MATLLDERTVTLEFADLRHRRQLPVTVLPRSPGWHQSDLLRDIALEYRWLKPGSMDDQEFRPGDYPWRWALGHAWEEWWFSFQEPETVWQPGERVEDGIAVNADGLTSRGYDEGKRPEWAVMHNIGVWVEETKHTEKRVRTGAEFLGEKLYMHQGRAYLYVYVPESRESGGVVRWTVMFYVGTRAGSGPIVKQYAVWFSGAEIRGSWNLLTERKRLLEEKGVMPPRQRAA